MSKVDIRVWLSLFYVVGTFLHLLMRSDLAMKSKVNSVPNRRCWLRAHWVDILVRVAFWGYLLFWGWLSHPDVFANIAKTFHVPDWLANWFNVVPNPLSCVGFGFICDVALDYTQVFTGLLVQKFPSLGWVGVILQSQVPQYSEIVAAAVDKEDKKVEEEGKNLASPSSKTIVVNTTPVTPPDSAVPPPTST